jgi:hypothetical protein
VVSPIAVSPRPEITVHFRMRCHRGRFRLPMPLGSLGRDCFGIFSVFRLGAPC